MIYFPLTNQVKTTILFQDLEVLKQRNSKKRKCSKNTDTYDSTIVDEFLKRRRCRPPYLKTHKSYPKCKSMEKIKESKLDLQLRKQLRLKKACQRISKSKINVNHQTFWDTKTMWAVTIEYPEEVKIITQTRDVDVHSLIGNIGRYLGLFLGKRNVLSIKFTYFVLISTKSLEIKNND